jgi:hypothetical protein
MIDTPSNSDLLNLFAADRAENRNVVAGTAAYIALRQRDTDRRLQVSEILSSLIEATKEDLYHAAWVLNHGDLPEEARRAHTLASKAASLGLKDARWLAAASLDRWHMYRGKPQKYGTQIVPDGIRYRVWDTAPETTDAERAKHGVPPISDQHYRAEELTRTTPQPSMDGAPAWLKSAISRWRMENANEA